MIEPGDKFKQRFSSDDKQAVSVIIDWLSKNDIRQVRAVDFMDVPHYCSARIDCVRVVRNSPDQSVSISGSTVTSEQVVHEYEVEFTVVSADAVR